MNAASLSLGYTTAVTGVTAVAPSFWIGSSKHRKLNVVHPRLMIGDGELKL